MNPASGSGAGFGNANAGPGGASAKRVRIANAAKSVIDFNSISTRQTGLQLVWFSGLRQCSGMRIWTELNQVRKISSMFESRQK